MHYETRETRYTTIFMCTFTKVSFLYTIRGGMDSELEKRPVRLWRQRAEETLTAEPPLGELYSLICDGHCSCDPGLELCWIPPPTLSLKASTSLDCCCFYFLTAFADLCVHSYCFNMEVLCRMQYSRKYPVPLASAVMHIRCIACYNSSGHKLWLHF